ALHHLRRKERKRARYLFGGDYRSRSSRTKTEFNVRAPTCARFHAWPPEAFGEERAAIPFPGLRTGRETKRPRALSVTLRHRQSSNLLQAIGRTSSAQSRRPNPSAYEAQGNQRG